MGPEGIDERVIDSQVGSSSLAPSYVEGRREGGLVGDKIELAALKEEHWERVYRLYCDVFGSRLADAFAARRRWARQQDLAPEATPGWVLLDGESVVGFLTTVPMRYLIDGVAVVAHTPADYMVHPNYRFHGIRLMQEFFRSCDNCVSCDDMRPTVRVIEWLGGKRAGALIRYVKILDGRVMRWQGRWGLVPPALWWPVTMALRGADRVRTRRLGSGVTVEALTNPDERFARFSQRLSHMIPAMPTKDRRFFEWRYGEASPQAGREIGVVSVDGELGGYVIFFLPGGPKRTGYILDLQVIPPGDTRMTRALMKYAVQQLRRAGAWTVRYHLLASPFALQDEVLEDFGFIPRGRHHFLVKFKDEQLAATAERQANWNYSFGDSEASHALE